MHPSKCISSASAVFIFAIIFCLPFSARADVANVLTNGGFETGDLTDWSEPAENPNPWTVVSSNPHTGEFSAYNPDLGGATSQATLYQSFIPTLVEDITSAGFWYFHQGNTGTVGLATLLTFSDGSAIQDTLFASDPLYKQNEWAYRDWTPSLQAESGKYLVAVGFFPKGRGTQYIDDVFISASPVPMPPSFYLLTTGLIVLFGMTRRKRSGIHPSKQTLGAQIYRLCFKTKKAGTLTVSAFLLLWRAKLKHKLPVVIYQ